jgi:hypothetical protein
MEVTLNTRTAVFGSLVSDNSGAQLYLFFLFHFSLDPVRFPRIAPA